MSISNLGAVGYNYTPQATSFTAKPYKGTEDFQPGLIMPEQTEKKNKHTVLKTVVTLAALVGTAIVLKKHGKSIWNKIKGLFNKGGKAAETVADNTSKAADMLKNVETKSANASTRKAVEQAIKDTPTKAQQVAYNESIKYVAPTAKQRAAIDANNALATKETAVAHQIQNMASPESVKALEQAKKGMTEVNTSLNGLFESNGAKLTLKDGKIVKIQTPDGRSITKELNIAKYENKHGIDLSKLTPASAPKAKPVAPKAPETPAPAPKAGTVATPKKTKAQAKAEALKKKQMDAAWKEYTQSKAPSADEILAQRQAELAKLDAKVAKSKDAQVSQAWAEHSPKVEAPKAETVASKAEAPKTVKIKQKKAAAKPAEAEAVFVDRLPEQTKATKATKEESVFVDKLPEQTKTPKTEQKVEDIFAQREAEATRLKKQQMDEAWATQQKEMDALRTKQQQDIDNAMLQSAAYDDMFHSSSVDDMFHNSSIDDMFHNSSVDDMFHNSSVDDMFQHTGFDDMLGF